MKSGLEYIQRFISLQNEQILGGLKGFLLEDTPVSRGIMLGILQTELFQIFCCVGNFHSIEPTLQLELFEPLSS